MAISWLSALFQRIESIESWRNGEESVMKIMCLENGGSQLAIICIEMANGRRKPEERKAVMSCQ
jgi:hypothetical protein